MKVSKPHLAQYNKILLSVCIPTYQRPSLLKRTLQSLEGGNPETEAIICDNSPDDDSEKTAKESLQNYKGPWCYFRNHPAIGPIENVNKSIKASSGKYAYVLHDDDYLLPGGLAKILAKLKEFPDVNVFAFGVKIVNLREKTQRIEKPWRQEYMPSRKALLRTLTDSSFIRMPSIVIRREAYEKVGYWDPATAPPDDIDMFARLFMEFSLLRSPSMVAAYTVHPSAWTGRMFNHATIRLLLDIFRKVEKKNIFDEKVLRSARASFLSQFILGGTYRSLRRLDWENARYILELFKIKELSGMSVPFKYQVIRTAFKMILLLSDSHPGFENSLKRYRPTVPAQRLPDGTKA